MPDATQTLQPQTATPENKAAQRGGGSSGGTDRMHVQLKSTDYEGGAAYLAPGGGAAAALRPSGDAEGGSTVQMNKTDPKAPEVTPDKGTEGTSEKKDAETPAPTGPVAKVNDYGKFDVYPDDFVGPLPANARDADVWVLHQSDYDNLVAKLDAVKGATSQISIAGDATFKSTTLLDLGWLMTVGTGQTLINALASSGFKTTIEKTTGGNACGYDPNADSWETTDTPPKAGKGANVTVSYNPARLQIGDGAGWKTRPAAIGLAHELVHAWTGVNGQRARGETDGTNNRELQAVGLGAYKDAVLTENAFRAAFGLPLRPVY